MASRFTPDYPVASLRAATYNPRKIDEESIEALRESLRVFGAIRPVVVTESGTCLAGHQRTKAMTAEGIERVPAYVMPSMPIADEIRFNQLHNGSDYEVCGSSMRVYPSDEPGEWYEADPLEITGDYTGGKAAKLAEICRLLAKYGAFGGVVATTTGEIIVGAIYAHACRLCGVSLLIRYVDPSQKEAIVRAFSRQYGVYSYSHLPKATWAQSLVQLRRLRGATAWKSSLYETHVIPMIGRTPDMRILDFGAGQMDYVKMLKSQGVKIRGLEFYLQSGGKLNVGQVQRDIDGVFRDLKTFGRYDLVVADSVMNSVDSMQAEEDVLLTLAALAKPGGYVAFSGRSRETMDRKEHDCKKKANYEQRDVNFIDADGFSGMYADGVWRFQKFHTVDQVMTLARFHGDRFVATNGEGRPFPVSKPSSAWHVLTRNDRLIDDERTEAALRREFDLPLPGGRFGRGEEAVDSWRSCKS